MRYTKELLEPLVKQSFCMAEVLRKLNVREAGGTHSHVTRRIKDFGIDVSHFLGVKAGCKSNGGQGKKHWSAILVKRTYGKRQEAKRLRRALIESGIRYECKKCTIDKWHGESLTLEVNHVNGDWLDDSRENLEFLCPNCHSQIPNHRKL